MKNKPQNSVFLTGKLESAVEPREKGVKRIPVVWGRFVALNGVIFSFTALDQIALEFGELSPQQTITITGKFEVNEWVSREDGSTRRRNELVVLSYEIYDPGLEAAFSDPKYLSAAKVLGSKESDKHASITG